jgi:hypothetical protein
MLVGKSPIIDPFLKSSDGRFHIREYHEEELKHYLQIAGFEVLESETWGIYKKKHWCFLLNTIGNYFPNIKNYFGIVATIH